MAASASGDGWRRSRPGPGRLAPGADDRGEGVVGFAAGHLLLQDRGQERLEHRLGAGDAQAGEVAVELADQPGGGEPVQRVARPQQLGGRLQAPPGPRPPGRDPDPVTLGAVAGRGRPLRRPGRPPPGAGLVDQHGRVARPRRSGPRVSRRSTGRRGRTTVSIGRCAAVIARILARPADNHTGPAAEGPRPGQGATRARSGSGPGSGRRYRAWREVGGTAERSVERYSAAAAWRRPAAPVRSSARTPSSLAQRLHRTWNRSARAASPRAAPTDGRDQAPDHRAHLVGAGLEPPGGRSSSLGITSSSAIRLTPSPTSGSWRRQ